MKKIMAFSLLALSLNTLASSIFVFKKNVNPQNVLHYKAHASNCEFKNPSVTAFWVMGEDKGQIESLTSKELEYLKPKIIYNKENEVDFTIGAIEELKGKITDKDISVRIVDCAPKAFIEIDGREVEIKEINLNLSTFLTVKDVTITGKSASGEIIKKKIEQ
jgi:hypothetical protein